MSTDRRFGDRLAARGLPALVAPALWLFLLVSPALGHEVRPGYLELREAPEGRIEVTFKQPLNAGRLLPLDPLLEPGCGEAEERRFEDTGTALIERWIWECGPDDGGSVLLGRRVFISGLDRTLTDALLTVQLLDGTELTTLLRAKGEPFLVSREAEVGVRAYLELGIEHLLFGFDHILFVVAMVLYVRRPWQIVKVVTAFTVAHSLTLALSTLGLVQLRQGPVEVVIALSILFLAVELAKPEPQRSPITTRRPWLVAFAFGLLHGFGFAGALAEIGLPRDAAALALLLFNVGVEIGQLLIVLALLAGAALLSRSPVELPRPLLQLPAWVLGVLSARWFLERFFGLFG
ncbi:MAG: HupE/UreJ family protein [Acidobacteriota bacterium]